MSSSGVRALEVCIYGFGGLRFPLNGDSKFRVGLGGFRVLDFGFKTSGRRALRLGSRVREFRKLLGATLGLQGP